MAGACNMRAQKRKARSVRNSGLSRNDTPLSGNDRLCAARYCYGFTG